MKRTILLASTAIFLAFGGIAQDLGHVPADRERQEPWKSPAFRPTVENPFPGALFPASSKPTVKVSFVPTKEEMKEASLAREKALPLLLNNHVLAFYGKPGARNMGILGQYPIDSLMPILDGYATAYDEANGAKGVVKAFYLIYATCWPGGEIGYLKHDVVMQYIDYAEKNGMLVFVDHQIGKYGVTDSLKRLLPYMKYPNVHAALDPEWRTLRPMQEIGSITGEELNEAQATLDAYLRDNGIPGKKMLVVHQFSPKMIQNRQAVRADYERVELIHCADGFGNPALKKLSYKMNADAENMPLKSFKLFLKPTIAGAGWDNPLLTPAEVLSLSPEPLLIMYQ